MNKRNIFVWALYDFANSFPVIVFGLYFSQWLVIENKVSDLYFNLIFVISSLLLIISAPILGSYSDKKGVKLPFLQIFTFLMFVTILVSGVSANLFKPTPEIIFIAALFFLLSNYFYQFCLIFYNALLPQISPEAERGKISGIGISAGWLGQIAGLLITLPLITGAIYLFGNPGRTQTFIPSIILFLSLSLPMLILFKEKISPSRVSTGFKKEVSNYLSNIKSLIKTPGLGRFLLGYFFFTDALLTAQNNYPIYLQQVFGVNDKTKAFLTMAILLTSVIGAVVSGWLADRVGLKKMLLLIMGAWIFVVPGMGLVTNFNLFVILSIIVGFLFGATYPVTRAIMAYLSPENKLSNAFSFYTLAERFSTFLGPLTWGLITFFLMSTGSFRYRIAMISMTIFIILGFLILLKIPSATKQL